MAGNLNAEYGSFRPGRALKYDVCMALGLANDAEPYRADKEAELAGEL